MLEKGVNVGPGARRSAAAANNSTLQHTRDPVGLAAELQRDVFKLATAALVCFNAVNIHPHTQSAEHHEQPKHTSLKYLFQLFFFCRP